MGFSIVNILVMIARNILDSFGIFGAGLCFMGRKIKIKYLLKLSLLIGIFITPIRFMPISMGMKVNIIFVIMIVLFKKMTRDTYSLLAVSGAVLIGSWLLISLEWLNMSLLTNYWAGTPGETLTGIVITFPSTVILIVLAIYFQINQIIPKHSNWSAVFELKSTRDTFYTTARLFMTFLIYATFATTVYRLVPQWIPKFSPLIIFSLILLSYQINKKRNFLLFNIIDFMILIPLINYILFLTGGHRSDYKFLFILLILINSLKSDKIYGLISLFGGSISIFIFGIVAFLNNLTWQVEMDIIYVGTFILVYWLINHFINQEDKLYQKISYKANTDELTSLYNSRFLYKGKTKDNYLESYLFFIDVDNFKLVNDTLGHLYGDELLRNIASGLEEVTRENDLLVRYGGDEFIILLKNVKDKDNIIELARRLKDNINEICNDFMENHRVDLPITVSIGIAQKDANIELEEVINKADQALITAKNRGKNRIFYIKK